LTPSTTNIVPEESAMHKHLPLMIVVCLGPTWSASATPSSPNSAPAVDPWSAWASLLGDWTATDPVGGTGWFSLQRDLGGKVLVRKNHAEYPAAKNRPAVSHDDLMVVFDEAGKIRARYFDNEGHVIDYSVSFADGGKRLLFVSDPKPGGPRFRLSYDLSKPDLTDIVFEIAPPNAPDQFKTFVTGHAQRRPSIH
jgi:hypothetical protein